MLNSFYKRETFSSYLQDDVVACSIYLYWEVFRPLMHGACALILENQYILDFDIYTQYLTQFCVTETLWTPSFAELLAKTATDNQIKRLSSLKRVWLNGEVVSEHLHQLLLEKLPDIRFFNLYSISETFDVSALELNSSQLLSQQTASIGKPFPNTELLLLKPDYCECSLGEQGELYIGGDSLAGGYLNQAEKEAASFIRLPQYPSSPYWFKTKDVAYQSESGSYYIIGRNDDIVKLRGYNISLLSIESVIKKHIPLRQCYVKLEQAGEGEDQQIVAYLRPENIEQFITDFDYDRDSYNSSILYQILSNSLPHYAIPSCFKIIDNVQFNAYSAKLVRKNREKERNDPIKALWQKCLNIPSKSITDDSDFFALGSSSLQAVQLVQYCNDQFKNMISVQTLYQYSRFQDFKAAIDGSKDIKIINPLIYEDINWQPSCPSSDIRNCNLLTAQTIFMTGVTGYIGIHWLHQILHQTSADIHCLVRCCTEAEGRKRIEKAFEQYAMSGDLWQNRITIIPGDLQHQHFGLSHSQWQSLSTEVDLVIHAAAQVNLMHEYGNLRASTILGTQTVLELATTDHIKPLFLISSDAVFHETNIDERESFLSIDTVKHLTYGYAQTKWAQEYLVQQLSRQFKIPYLIVRLGNVAPSLCNRRSNPSDANGMVLKAIKMLKRQPKGLQLEFCPIDRLVNVLTDISKNSFDNRIISLNGINTVSSQLLKQLLPEWRIDDIEYKDWQKNLVQLFPELYGLTSIPQLFTRQYESVQNLISMTPYVQKLQLDETELRNSLLAMAE